MLGGVPVHLVVDEEVDLAAAVLRGFHDWPGGGKCLFTRHTTIKKTARADSGVGHRAAKSKKKLRNDGTIAYSCFDMALLDCIISGHSKDQG